MVAIAIAQGRLEQFAGGRVRKAVDEQDFVRKPPFGDSRAEMGEDRVGADLRAFLADDQQQRPLVPFGMPRADRRRLGDARAADRRILQLDRADPFAAGFDHVLGTVGDLERAAGVEDGDVPGVEPAALARAIARLVLKLAADHPGAANLEAARALAVARLFLLLVVDDPELDSEGHPALLAAEIDLL